MDVNQGQYFQKKILSNKQIRNKKLQKGILGTRVAIEEITQGIK